MTPSKTSLDAASAVSPFRLWALDRLRGWWTDRLDLVLLMTLLLLLLYSSNLWYVQVPLRLLILLAIFLPRVRSTPFWWFFGTGLILAGTYQNWHLADNHKYLTGYWCLAIGIALLGKSPVESLRTSARWLIALTFAFALFWKAASPDFRDGSFFEYTLLTDQRFQWPSQMVGGTTGEDWDFNRTARRALLNYDSTLKEVAFRSSPRIGQMAEVVTYWTILIEGLILLAFALPARWVPARAGDLLLLGFVIFTYPVAPVLGFGWLLLTMGLAQLQPPSRGLAALYLGIFVVLQAVPVLGLLRAG